jgi:alpha-galactosidase
MIHTLQNSQYKLSVNPVWGLWSLVGNQPGPELKNIHMGVFYQTSYRKVSGLKPGTPMAVDSKKTVTSKHGPLQQIELISEPDRHGLTFQVTFALTEREPFMLSKMRVENKGNKPLYLERLEFLNAGFVYVAHASLPLMKYTGYKNLSGLPNGSISLSPEIGELAFFSNGWQSWSYTGTYGLPERFRRTRLGLLRSPVCSNVGTPQPKRIGLYSSDMFGIIGDRIHRKGILVGFLSQAEHFGSMEALLDPFNPALRVWANADSALLNPGAIMETDWLCIHFLHLDAPDPLGSYMEAVARENRIETRLTRTVSQVSPTDEIGMPAEVKKIGIPTGWCSWYHYFQKVTAQDIHDNLSAAKQLRDRLPLDLIQIDDGFEAQIGDWQDFSSRFPEGVEPISKEISTAGFIPGLWLAPFILHRKSRLAREHPSWVLRNRCGLPVNAGFLWDSFATGLDLTQPEALDYACEVVQTAAHKWGYPYLKLDFLYAAALPGRYQDRTKTRAQVLRQGMLALRQAVGERVFLLGCGCPLGSALGVVDAMRIGSDVDIRWRPAYKGIRFYMQDEPDIPSARNAIQNALSRAPMHKRWWINDPDCLLLTQESELTSDEVQTLASVIALTGGSMIISDDLSQIPPERIKIAEVLLPIIGKTPHLLDWFDSITPSRVQLDLEGPTGKWHLIGLFNWSELAVDMIVNLSDFYIDTTKSYYLRSFWDGKIYHIQKGDLHLDQLDLGMVPAHGSMVLTLHRSIPGLPQYVGSDLHISQGMEVSSWQWNPETLLGDKGKKTGMLALSLERPGIAHGKLYLALPSRPRKVTMNNLPITWSCESSQTYSLEVDFIHRADIEVQL